MAKKTRHYTEEDRRNLCNRRLACQHAAQVMSAVLHARPTESLTPMLWSLAVFFESYMSEGSEGTRKNFGPKKAVKLRVVK